MFTTPSAESYNGAGPGGTSISVGPLSTGAAGSLTIACVMFAYTSTETCDSVEDDLANGFTSLGYVDFAAVGYRMYIFYFENSDGGSRTFTANFSTSVGDRYIEVSVWPGALTSGAFGGENDGAGSASTTTSSSVTPTEDNALVLGFVSDTSLEDGDIVSPATLLSEVGLARVGYAVQTAAEARAITFAHSAASAYCGRVVWFKAQVDTIPPPAAHAPIDDQWAPMFDALF